MVIDLFKRPETQPEPKRDKELEERLFSVVEAMDEADGLDQIGTLTEKIIGENAQKVMSLMEKWCKTDSEAEADQLKKEILSQIDLLHKQIEQAKTVINKRRKFRLVTED